MHAVFAVEPRSIDNWKDFRYLIEKFGFHKGVLIARYPKKWMSLVLDACDANNIGDVERLKVVEKLRQAKEDRMLNTPFPFDGGEWLENVNKPGVANIFDALVLREDDANAHSYRLETMPEELFDNRREMESLRDRESLATVASRLFVDAIELTLIDPYLKPSRACTHLLNSFIESSFSNGKGIKKLVIHMAFSKDESEPDEVIKNYKKYLGNKISDGLIIQVNRWRDTALEFDFHARYLLTEKAGIRYDRGFIEPSDHDERAKKTDVVCIEPGTVDRLRLRYSVTNSADDIVDVIDIRG